MGSFTIPLGSGGEKAELRQEFGGFGASWIVYEGQRVKGPIEENGVKIEVKDGKTYYIKLQQQLGDIYPKVFVNNEEFLYVERPPRWMALLSASLIIASLISATMWWDRGFIPALGTAGAYIGCQLIMYRVKSRSFSRLGVLVLSAIGWLLPFVW